VGENWKGSDAMREWKKQRLRALSTHIRVCVAAGLNCAAGRQLDWEEVSRTLMWWGREKDG
jgi:hypothetical protein